MFVKQVNLGVIGCGVIGTNHIFIIQQITDAIYASAEEGKAIEIF